MKRPTKEERHVIYKSALEYYKNDLNVDCLCEALTNCKANKRTYNAFSNMGTFFPEVYKHKPEYKASELFWFLLNDRQSRISILEQAINETA